MSDYLTNLAARTLAAPSLRPRVRMRFEPETGEDSAPPPIEASAPMPPVRAAEVPVSEPPRVAEVTREVSVSAPPPPTAETPQPPAVAAAPVRHVEHETRVVERVRERVEKVETNREVTRVETHENAAEKEPPPPPHRYDLEAPKPGVVWASGLPLVAPAPKTKGRPEAYTTRRAGTPIPDTPTFQPEPTVHVSIGRIEVRASTPAPARGAKPARPVMTIDDYVARKKDRR